jgi:hypothetical protein
MKIRKSTAVLPPDLIANASPGNRAGVARAYGHAAMFLANGKAPPAELTAWLSERRFDEPATHAEDLAARFRGRPVSYS